MAIHDPGAAWEQFTKAEPAMSQDPAMAFHTGFQMGKLAEIERQKQFVHPNIVRIMDLIRFAETYPEQWRTLKLIMPDTFEALTDWLTATPGPERLTARWAHVASELVSESQHYMTTPEGHPTSGGAEEVNNGQ